MVPAVTALTAMMVTTGRCSRKGLLVCVLVLLALQAAAVAALLMAGIEHDGWLGWTVGALFLWLCTCAVAKRLHDLGLSARLIFWAVFAVVAWSTVLDAVLAAGFGEELQPIGSLVAAAVGIGLPVAALTLWLHLARGMPGPNRYGIEPDASGFCGGLPLCGPVNLPAPPETAPAGDNLGCADACVRQAE